MYEDILEFHRRALHYFQKPSQYRAGNFERRTNFTVWRQLYHATWKTFKSRFAGLMENMCQHRELVDRQANLSQIEESRRARQISDRISMDREDAHRLQVAFNWLRAPTIETDQHYFSEIRAEYSNTGRWLLDKPAFKLWFDPQFPAIPPLLWLNGMPGAGNLPLKLYRQSTDALY